MVQALLKTEPNAKPVRGRPWPKGETPKGARPWAPGQSGNPGGLGGNFIKAQMIYREASPEAARVMVELMADEDPRVRGFAADKVMERAWGKARDYDPKEEIPDNAPIDPAQFTAKQRAFLRQGLELLVRAMPLEVEPEAAPQEKAP